MAPSFMVSIARYIVTKFFEQYISAGCIILSEKDGQNFTFQGSMEKCSLTVVLEVQNPQFYWKLMTEADFGLADAFINGGYFSFKDDDKEQSLVNLFMILLANRESNTTDSGLKRRVRGWLPPLFTATISSAKYILKQSLRQNTLTQARRNISQIYDLSNELYELFLGETMQYSCAIFKAEDEELKVAQHRKFSTLIDKARIEKGHDVLEIGCGWGIFAVEIVRRTGCKYTGVTLSEQQLKYAEAEVKKAGLEENIKFLHCDYRQIPNTTKYDRIISCEMIEHVGHEYYEEFFRCCDSLLAENGIFVLQFTGILEELYDEYRQSPGFAKEIIFPGGCLPSLTRLLKAMNAASRLSVEQVENIGSHFVPTFQYWRKNFMENQSKILALGFDEKFIRTWEYYFDYVIAGYKSRTLLNYQVVFSRPGNFAAFGDQYQGFPSAYSY